MGAVVKVQCFPLGHLGSITMMYNGTFLLIIIHLVFQFSVTVGYVYMLTNNYTIYNK